jgi:hypothetical protein
VVLENGGGDGRKSYLLEYLITHPAMVLDNAVFGLVHLAGLVRISAGTAIFTTSWRSPAT